MKINMAVVKCSILYMYYVTNKIPNSSTGSRIIQYNILRIKNLLKNITAPLEVQPPPPSVLSILEECYSWWRWLAKSLETVQNSDWQPGVFLPYSVHRYFCEKLVICHIIC